jgi:hypothetical protein
MIKINGHMRKRVQLFGSIVESPGVDTTSPNKFRRSDLLGTSEAADCPVHDLMLGRTQHMPSSLATMAV